MRRFYLDLIMSVVALSGCRTSEQPGLRFMAASNETFVRANLKVLGERIEGVLDRTQSVSTVMPPINTAEYIALNKEVNEPQRLQMLQMVRNLIVAPQL